MVPPGGPPAQAGPPGPPFPCQATGRRLKCYRMQGNGVKMRFKTGFKTGFKMGFKIGFKMGFKIGFRVDSR